MKAAAHACGPVAWQDAVQGTPRGCRLLLEVVPGARTAAFPDGFDAWRGRIRARVMAAARDGEANRELLATLARFFSVPLAAVALDAGGADRRKTVSVALDRDAALRRLAAALEAA